MQTQFGMQRTLDGEMQADTAPIDAAMAAAKKEKEAMAQRRQREQARQSVADAEGQQTLKSFCDCEHCFGIDTAWDLLEKKLCPAGKAAAKRKFKVYPSAYANGWAVQYCKGKFRKKKGGKKK